MQKYKLISELTPEELGKVFDLNTKLQDAVLEDMLENAQFWTGKYLKCWESGISYSIGYDRGDYLSVEYRDCFIAGLEKAQHNYGLLPDSVQPLIDKASLLLERLDYTDQKDDIKNYNRIDARLDEVIEDLRRLTFRRLQSEYSDCFNSDYQKDYFIEFYHSERLSDESYIDHDFYLYEDVHFTKCYK